MKTTIVEKCYCDDKRIVFEVREEFYFLFLCVLFESLALKLLIYVTKMKINALAMRVAALFTIRRI